jgi:hypothetical protein
VRHREVASEVRTLPPHRSFDGPTRAVRLLDPAPAGRRPVGVWAINRSVDSETHPFGSRQPSLPSIPFWRPCSIIDLREGSQVARDRGEEERPK